MNDFIKKIENVLSNYPNGLTVHEIAKHPAFKNYIESDSQKESAYRFRNLQRDIKGIIRVALKNYLVREEKQFGRSLRGDAAISVYFYTGDEPQDFFEEPAINIPTTNRISLKRRGAVSGVEMRGIVDEMKLRWKNKK